MREFMEIVSVRARHGDAQDWFAIIERRDEGIIGLRAYRRLGSVDRIQWGSLETLPIEAICVEPPDLPKPPPPSDSHISTQLEIVKQAAAMEIVAVRRGNGASWFAVLERYEGNPGALVGMRYQASSTRFGDARWITGKIETVPADHLTTRQPTCARPALPPAWMLGRAMRNTWGDVVYDPNDGWGLAPSGHQARPQPPAANARPVVTHVQAQPTAPAPPPPKWWQFWRRGS
jgi:hypothetical protein